MESFDLILKEVRPLIKPEYRKSIFEANKPLASEHISSDIGERFKPEDFTKRHIIDKVIGSTSARIIDGELAVEMNDSIRWVDYRVDIGKKKYLLEAKALNVDLYDKSPDGAVNQIRRTFKMADVKEKYEGGIATDGRIWVFLDKDGNDRQKLDAQKDYDKIVKILNGDQTIRRDIRQEDISKKFYKQYREIVNGGGNIALEDCLTNSITNVVDDDRKEIAQRIINRLIFIKMLQSRNIIKNDVINYVANIEPEFRNFKLNQLFFDVMNVQSDKRDFSIDSEFRDIPYLNGGLFNKSDAELRNADYYVKPDIIKSIALFLDSFRYTDEWEEDSDSLDPEILGYIFEMAMAEEERSSTGSFYTPKEITEFMAEQAILDQIVRKINRLIISEYRNIKPIEKYNDLFSKERMGPHQNSILVAVMEEIIWKMKICDNACGSGAFLLAAANVLFLIARRIRDYVGLATRDIGIKRIILKDCIYGVDLNRNAVEIAKLRLWLWLIGSYKIGDIQPLPNIDFNIRSGNSIVGYTDISRFYKISLTNLDDWASGVDAEISSILKRRSDLISKYKGKSGLAARTLRNDINKASRDVRNKLDQSFYQENCVKLITPESYKEQRPFHWGFEYNDVFEDGGFDIIIGNPPYVENKEIDTNAKLIYKPLYKTAYKLYDLSVLFMERSYQLLKEGGTLSYITTNKFLASDYGKKLREFLVENADLKYLVDVSYIKIFKEASAYPVIIGFDKTNTADNELFTYPHMETTVDFRRQLEKKEQHIPQSDFKLTDTYIFNISERIDICQKMDSIPGIRKLGSFSPVFVYRPFGFTGYYDWVKKFTYTPPDVGLKVIGTSSIARYHVIDTKIQLKKRIENAYMPRDVIGDDIWNKLLHEQILVALSVLRLVGHSDRQLELALFEPKGRRGM